jgi:hypothetical protein
VNQKPKVKENFAWPPCFTFYKNMQYLHRSYILPQAFYCLFFQRLKVAGLASKICVCATSLQLPVGNLKQKYNVAMGLLGRK